MKTSIKLLGFLFASLTSWGNMAWDFSGGNTTGWSTVNSTLSGESGGWDDYYLSGFETPPRNYVTTETITSNGNAYDCLNVSGQFAKLDIAGQFAPDRLASCVNGSMSHSWTDSGMTDPTVGGSYNYDIPEYILFTGTVGGRSVMLGYELPLSSNPLMQVLTVHFSASQFTVIDKVSYTLMSPSPDYTFGAGLSDADFAEFMSTCDSMYVRSLAAASGSVGGSGDFTYYTKLSGVSFTKALAVPESSSSALFLFSAFFLAYRRPSRNQAR